LTLKRSLPGPETSEAAHAFNFTDLIGNAVFELLV
jgi:hypothetical protein